MQGFITSALVKWLGALDWYFNWDIINEMCMSGSLFWAKRHEMSAGKKKVEEPGAAGRGAELTAASDVQQCWKHQTKSFYVFEKTKKLHWVWIICSPTAPQASMDAGLIRIREERTKEPPKESSKPPRLRGTTRHFCTLLKIMVFIILLMIQLIIADHIMKYSSSSKTFFSWNGSFTKRKTNQKQF